MIKGVVHSLIKKNLELILDYIGPTRGGTQITNRNRYMTISLMIKKSTGKIRGK